MALTDEQEYELTQGGDCHLHSHAFDRSITQDSVLQFQDSERIRKVTASYAVQYSDDYLFVDTTSGAVTLTLPTARGGKSYCIVRIAGANNVTIARTSPDTINGATSLVISASYAPVRLKALKGTGWIQV